MEHATVEIITGRLIGLSDGAEGQDAVTFFKASVLEVIAMTTVEAVELRNEILKVYLL